MKSKYGQRKIRAIRARDGRDAKYKCNSFNVPYSDEEREFMVAMDKFKRESSRPHPTWAEVLGVAKGLGYRK